MDISGTYIDTNNPYHVIQNSGNTKATVNVYKRRWYVLLLFCLLGLTQGTVWNTWGPISDSATLVFKWSDADIAMFANVGNIFFCLFVFLSSYIMDVLGLRTACLLSVLMITMGAGVRCITSDPEWMYWLSMVGSATNGIAGTVTFAGLALFSNTWFPISQRSTATGISNLAISLGNSASLLGPQIVHYINPENATHHNGGIDITPTNNQSSNITESIIEKQRNEIMKLMYIECGFSGILMLLLLFYFPSKPPLPPSLSASSSRMEFRKGLWQLTKQLRFWMIGLSYAIPTGVLGIWCSVLNINLKPVGISQDEAGWLGFYYITAGAITGLFVSRFSDIFSRHMKVILVSLYILAGGSLVWVLLLVEQYIPFHTVSLYSSVIMTGIFVNGAIPLFFELSCEMCYPVAEGITGGYLTLLNNLAGTILLFMFDIPNIGVSWLNWSMLVSVISGIPLLLLIPESYARLQLDSQEKLEPTVPNYAAGQNENGQAVSVTEDSMLIRSIPSPSPHVIRYDEPINFGQSLSSSLENMMPSSIET